MRYLCFIRHSEKYRENPPPPALMSAIGSFMKETTTDGTLVETGRLLPSKDRGSKSRMPSVTEGVGYNVRRSRVFALRAVVSGGVRREVGLCPWAEHRGRFSARRSFRKLEVISLTRSW